MYRKLIMIYLTCLVLPAIALAGSPISNEEKEVIIRDEWEKQFGSGDLSRPVTRPEIVPSPRILVPSAPSKGKSLSAGRPVVEKKVVQKSREPEPILQPQPSVIKKAIPPAGAATKFEKLITIRANAADIKTVVSEIAGQCGYNAKFESDVNQNYPVTASYEKTAAYELLDNILTPPDYDYRISDKILTVYAHETRAFQINIPSVSNVISNTITNVPEEKNETGQVISTRTGAKIKLTTQNVMLSFWSDLDKNISNMISKDGGYTVNPSAGIVTVKDSPSRLDMISEYIAIVNREVSKQVLMECKIVEVTLNKKNQYGIDWEALTDLADIQKLSLTSDITSKNLTGEVFTISAEGDKWTGSGTTARGIKAVLRALESQGDVNVLSQPKELLLNNQPAVIQVGDVISYIKEVKQETAQVTGTTSYSVDTADIQSGVTLYVLARIGDDGMIYTHISPVVTTVNEIRKITFGSTTVEAPNSTSKSMNTMLKVSNRDTIVIGGLITQRKEKSTKGLPLLSSIPLLGEVFKYTSDELKRSEIVIFITPRII